MSLDPIPSAPPLEFLESTASFHESTKFEWNVEKLFSENLADSRIKAIGRKIFAAFAVVPTLFFDLGRYLSYSCGLSDGKSFNLIEMCSSMCVNLARKVNNLFRPKEPTFKEKVAAHVKELVQGYEKLNGGWFHSNNSFSTPYAIQAQRQIDCALKGLVKDAQEHVASDADTVSPLFAKQQVVRRYIYQAIFDASKNKYFVPNKSTQSAKPIAEFAIDAFDEAFKKGESHSKRPLIKTVQKEGTALIEELKSALESRMMTKEEVITTLKSQAEFVYTQKLETGIAAAEEDLVAFLESAIREGVISRKEAHGIDAGVQPDVELLARAAAKEIEDSQEFELIKTSLMLISTRRLESLNMSQFVFSLRKEVSLQPPSPKADAESPNTLLNDLHTLLSLIEKKEISLMAKYKGFEERAEKILVAQELEKEHDALMQIKMVYNAFKKNHWRTLNADLLKIIAERELPLQRALEELNVRHNEIIDQSKIFARLHIDRSSKTVSKDPISNSKQVQALLAVMPQPSYKRWWNLGF